MTIAVATLNKMADAETINTIKVHSGNPGASGTANTISGGSKACTYGASASGTRDLSATVKVPVPSGATVSHFSLWNGSTFVAANSFTTAPETYANDGEANVTTAPFSVAEKPAT